MSNLPETTESVNPGKTRAEYMALAESSIKSARRLLKNFNEETDDSNSAISLLNIIMREAEVYVELAKLAPESPSSNTVSSKLLRAADAALRYFETHSEGIHPLEIISNLRTAIASSMTTPFDPCADELAQQIGVMSDQNAKLYREKSALLDLIYRAFAVLDCESQSALNNDIADALREAGRL